MTTKKLQFKRYANNVIANTIGADGELIVNTNDYSLTIHNGVTPGGTKQATEAFVLSHSSVYGDSNVASYLPTYSGEISANDLVIKYGGITFSDNTFQNTAYDQNFVQSAYDKANTDNSLAQSSFDKANTVINYLPLVGGTLTGDLVIQGNISLSGSSTTYTSNISVISEPILYLAGDNPADLVDIGFYGHFIGNGVSSFSHYQHTGLIRDFHDQKWKLFSNVSEPQASNSYIDFTNAIYDTLQVGTIEGSANISGGQISIGGFTANTSETSFQDVTVKGYLTSKNYIKTPYKVVAPQSINNQGSGLLTLNSTLAIQSYRMVITPNGKFAYSVNNTSNALIRPYSIDQSTGALTTLTTVTPNGTPSTVPTIAINAKGTFLYVSTAGGTGGYQIQVFSLDQSTGTITYSSSYTLPTSAQCRAITIHPTGKFLYYTTYATAPYAVYQLSIDQSTGALTVGSSLVMGSFSTFDNFAIEPTGRFLYMPIIGPAASINTIEVYSINQSTGQLTLLQSIAAGGAQPRSIAVDPSGRFLYITCYNAGTVGQFSIDQSTGLLTSIASPISSGTQPEWISIDPSGQFAYVTNHGASTISIFYINQGTGILASLGTIASPTTPDFVIIDPTGRFAYVNADTTAAQRQYLINSFSAGQANIAYLNTANIVSTGNVTANYFIGNGSLLTGISSYANSNVAIYLPTYTGNLDSLTGSVTTTANVTGNNVIANTVMISFGPSDQKTDINLIILTQAFIA